MSTQPTQIFRPGQIQIGIIGHSFVKRMSTHLSQDKDRQWSNLNLPVAQFKVHIKGQGGLTMKQLRSWSPCELGFSKVKPDLVYLEIGSNDLCDFTVMPEVLAKHVAAFADYLCLAHGINTVYVGQVLQRFKMPDTCSLSVAEYKRRAIAYNKALEARLKGTQGHVHFWRHRGGFWGANAQLLFQNDGVHLSKNVGMIKYLRSVQQAVSHAKSQGFV